jgi:hypothetical protein
MKLHVITGHHVNDINNPTWCLFKENSPTKVTQQLGQNNNVYSVQYLP